jgi:hypothetical protein
MRAVTARSKPEARRRAARKVIQPARDENPAETQANPKARANKTQRKKVIRLNISTFGGLSRNSKAHNSEGFDTPDSLTVHPLLGEIGDG